MVFTSSIPAVEEPQCNIVQFLFENRLKIPENRKILIDVATGASLTLAQLKDLSLRFAAGLQDVCNFKRNDVVLLFAPNQYDYSVPVFGTVAAGGACSPANPTYTARELAYQLGETKAKVLIAIPENLDIAFEAAASVGLPKERIFVFGDKDARGIRSFKNALIGTRKAELIKYTPEEAKETVAYLCFSSGTTGRSKGVMTTHANMTANILQAHAMELGNINGDKDKTLVVLPFFHIFALMCLLHFALYLGVPAYVMQRFDLDTYCKTVEKEKITYGYVVPPIVLALAKQPQALKYNLSSLRFLISGAAPLGMELLQAMKTRFPAVEVKQGYGLTETTPVSIMEPSGRTIPGSIGILAPNMTAKIVDESGKELGVGERGELWLKGPNIMKGYINNPQATADCIDAEGYFHTGDVAYIDRNGHFYIVDRVKELIKYKGFQVPPAELEALLLNSPDVADCAVIGVYDPQQATELPTAYIKLMPNVPQTEETAARLAKYVADQVVHYKQIRAIKFIDEIPKSASGKILRRVLRDAAQKEAAAPRAKL